MLLIAGVIDPTTNYVEHPEVVADRIETAADAIGDPRRVLAGTDCGFDTAAGLGAVAEEVVSGEAARPARRRRSRDAAGCSADRRARGLPALRNVRLMRHAPSERVPPSSTGRTPW